MFPVVKLNAFWDFFNFLQSISKFYILKQAKDKSSEHGGVAVISVSFF